jgi:hypothetical protein
MRSARNLMSGLALFVVGNTKSSEYALALVWDTAARAGEIAKRAERRLGTE